MKLVLIQLIEQIFCDFYRISRENISFFSLLLLITIGSLNLSGCGEVKPVEERVVDIPGLPSDAVPFEFVLVPAGSFQMGADPNDQESEAREAPQHQVNIDYNFYIGKYEITKAQWELVMKTRPWARQKNIIQSPDSPAVYISWEDTQAFIEKMHQLGQGTFRLPSEAEWEYACRAGTTTRFYWGDDSDLGKISAYAWWWGNADSNSQEYAHIVGLKKPNPFNLHDMSGNVWEWCQDLEHLSYKDAPSDGSAWEIPSAPRRVLRGGAWADSSLLCRSSYREFRNPDENKNNIGFRLVATDLPVSASPELALSVSSLIFSPSQTERRIHILNLGNSTLLWRITESISWLKCETSEGNTSLNGVCDGIGEDTIILKFDRTGLPDGNYDSHINLSSNGGDAVVSVSLQVTGSQVEQIIIDLPAGQHLEMVKISPGSFLMGCYEDEKGITLNEEEPQHRVDIHNSFFMGKYVVTKAQWEAVMGTKPWTKGLFILHDPASPAVCITWQDAQAFIDKLNQRGKGTFRLPSEAEWEYACRAGTTTRFYWGDDPDYEEINNYAWWQGNANSIFEEYSHVVGQKLPNSFGLYDMSGNVSEWCQDWYHSGYLGAPTDGSAWEEPPGDKRVLRGGCWHEPGFFCRSASRRGYPPSSAFNYFGFRVVKDL